MNVKCNRSTKMKKSTDNLTLGEIKELMTLFGKQSALELPYSVGDKVFIRTVTHYLTGRIKRIVGKFLVLTEAAWIADTGRFMKCIEKGNINECEPVTSDVCVNSDTIVDSYQWLFDLPKVQK